MHYKLNVWEPGTKCVTWGETFSSWGLLQFTGLCKFLLISFMCLQSDLWDENQVKDGWNYAIKERWNFLKIVHFNGLLIGYILAAAKLNRLLHVSNTGKMQKIFGPVKCKWSALWWKSSNVLECFQEITVTLQETFKEAIRSLQTYKTWPKPTWEQSKALLILSMGNLLFHLS